MNVNIFDLSAILLVIAAILAFFNHHVLRLPFTIGMTVSALLATTVILLADSLFPGLFIAESLRTLLANIDFTESLLHGMLSFLLFAGALHVDIEALWGKKAPIFSLASVGVLLSTALFGFGAYAIFQILGIPVSLPFCLVFGALISPTDPIAVLSIMKSLHAPKSLETKMAGESLFNDGFGVVVFSLLLSLALTGSQAGAEPITTGKVIWLFIHEVLGGVGLGFICGLGVYYAMRSIDEPNLEVLISVALVMGITFLAFQLHVSAPLACVVAGLFIGNHGKKFAMTKPTREALDHVWSFFDHGLNAILFLLIGLEVVVLQFSSSYLVGGILFILLSLVARFVSVALPILLLKLRYEFSPGVIKILTVGGLKGGISVALALSLPRMVEGRDAILAGTYAVVVFSIVVQGLAVKPLLESIKKSSSNLE